MIVVSDATPLISLARIDRFELLRLLFREIHIPTEVFHETVTRGRSVDGAKDQVLGSQWIHTVEVLDPVEGTRLVQNLDPGEREAILLAQQLKADWTLMDERKGRRVLELLGLRKAGTVGILLMAKRAGHLSKVRGDLEALHQRGFSLSQQVIESILEAAGE